MLRQGPAHLLGWLLLAGAVALPLAAQDVPYRVVVHASNPITRLTREQVSRIFLRKATLWDDRRPVLPVDQEPDAPVRRAFTREIHRRTIAAVQTYWQQQTFAGEGVAPPTRASDNAVLGYIRQYPGAIGYVHADADLGRDIKVVIVTP
ncbi:MAG: substrate-binding domain-containing protein [Gemmatimonadales bacterium]